MANKIHVLIISVLVIFIAIILFLNFNKNFGNQTTTFVPTTQVTTTTLETTTKRVITTPATTTTLQQSQPKTVEVEIKNFAYSPATITIKVGDTVKWINIDSVSHTATANDGSFDTGYLSQGQSKSITFDRKGVYDYYCRPHPWMKGKVIVE